MVNITKGHLCAAALATVFAMGIVVPAQARGIVADGTPVQLISNVGCALNAGSSCVPFTSSDTSTAFYVYNDGLVTIGTYLPATTTLGDVTGPNAFSSLNALIPNTPYILLGSNDYSALNMSVSLDHSFANETGPAEYSGPVTLDWIFSGPGGATAVFGLSIDDSVITAGYGAGVGSWFDTMTPNPYCDPYCTSTDHIDGTFLPDGSLVGSNLDGTILNLENDPSTFCAHASPLNTLWSNLSIVSTRAISPSGPR